MRDILLVSSEVYSLEKIMNSCRAVVGVGMGYLIGSGGGGWLHPEEIWAAI